MLLIETFSDLLRDPAHWEFELLVGFIEMLVFDLLFGVIVWQKLMKPYLARRKAEIIAQEHAKHNIQENC